MPLTFLPAAWRTRLEAELTSSGSHSPPPVSCGLAPCLSLLSCEVLGVHDRLIWVLISHVLGLAYCSSQSKPGGCKKATAVFGFSLTGTAVALSSPVKLSCWFREGSRQGSMIKTMIKTRLPSHPSASSSPHVPAAGVPSCRNQHESGLKASLDERTPYILGGLTVRITWGVREDERKVNSFFSLREFLFSWRLDTLYTIPNITNPQSRHVNIIHELCAMDASSAGYPVGY